MDNNSEASMNMSLPPTDSLEVVVYGYVTPPLVIITTITNVLVCIVLLKGNMRSPTNCVLAAMALSDMFTGLLPLVPFLYFFTFGHIHDWMTYEWCFAFDTLTDILPTVVHTASIWLTVALAVQRYICVCRPTVAVRICTTRNVVKVIGLIYLAAFFSQVCKFGQIDYLRMEQASALHENVTMVTCLRQPTKLVKEHEDLFYGSYYWFRVVFIHLVPCVSLIVINALLIAVIRKAQARRRKLLRQNRRSECRQLKESNCTTMMLVLVVGVFLVVEFPLALLLILFIVHNSFIDWRIITMDTEKAASMIINLAIVFSYPANFFIYCAMSRQFRETFTRLFRAGATPLERYTSHYLINATENGHDRMEKTETRI